MLALLEEIIVRLSKQIKEAILKAALEKAGIFAREAAIKSRYAAWAEAVRVYFVTPEVEQLIATARAASDAVPYMFKERSFCVVEKTKISVNVGGVRREIYWAGNVDYKASEYQERVSPNSSAVIATDNQLTEQLYTIDHDAKELKDEKEQLSLSLWAVLNSVSTDKRLIEVWPEAVAFIPAAERAATTNLPALPIAELNKLIGLP